MPVGAVVCVHDAKMDEPWCLVASEATVPTGSYSVRVSTKAVAEPAIPIKLGNQYSVVGVEELSVVVLQTDAVNADSPSVLPDNWVYITGRAFSRASRAFWILASVFAPSAFHL